MNIFFPKKYCFNKNKKKNNIDLWLRQKKKELRLTILNFLEILALENKYLTVSNNDKC